MNSSIVRIIALFLLAVMLAGTAQAAANNFWTELDVTFWQTVPFVAFWGYAIGTQLAGGGAVDWNSILAITAAVSAANAYLHARRATAQ